MSPAPCLEDDLLDGVGHGGFADVVEVGLRPVGLAGVGHAVAQHEAEQLLLGAAARLDGVGARAAEVAHGLVGGGRDVDRVELSGAQQAGELLGVFLVTAIPIAAKRFRRRPKAQS